MPPAVDASAGDAPFLGKFRLFMLVSIVAGLALAARVR
eukprot:gene11109-22466_t